jgi:hypothetical protein
MLMEPSVFTVSAWQAAQDAASFGPPSRGWPVGGIAWHDPQVSGATSFQRGMARVPTTGPSSKLPWQETLLQVFETGSNVAPAWWTAGFCEKSTLNPEGAWQPAQVTAGAKAPPTRWVLWFDPSGTSPDVPESVVALLQATAVTERTRTTEPERNRSARMAPLSSRVPVLLPM